MPRPLNPNRPSRAGDPYTKAYNHRPEVREKRITAERARRHNDPEFAKADSQRGIAYFKKNKAKRYAAMAKWTAENRDKMRAYYRDYWRHARQTDPYYNIRNRLCSRLWHAVTSQNGRKAFKTEDLIGCTVAALRNQLQGQFTDGMTWEKFLNGEIHIDHKVPCASFDLSDPDQQKLCFHYTNLQPLWAKDNLSKSDTLK